MDTRNKGFISRKTSKTLNWVIFALAVISDALLVYCSFAVARYSGFSKTIFTLINVGLILLALVVNGVAFVSFPSRKLAKKIISIVVCVFISVPSVYGVYALTKVNTNVDKIVDTKETVKESLSVAFVTYNNSIILDEGDIEGHKFGIVGNSSFQEGNVLAKDELDSKGISVQFVEYDNYNDLLSGLFVGECEVAALPANYYEMFIVNDGYEEYLKLTNIVHQFDKVVEVANESGVDIDVTAEPFTVLVMGIDEGRTDSLIMMSVNPNTMTLTMTSIPRDSYVPIACYSGKSRDKINHARTVSRQCTIDTVEELLEVNVDFYVETNFKGVVDIVNAIGGLWLYSPIEFDGQDSSTERGHYTVHIFQGWQVMNGEQSLAFARERYKMPNGDFDRQQHQQEVIEAMIDSIFDINDVNKLLGILDAAGENVKTNMSVNQMTSLANYVLKVGTNTRTKTKEIIKIKNSRITGYDSYYYNYGMRLPLWIMLPWNGAIADAKNLISDNIRKPLEKVLAAPKPFEASIDYYDEPVYFQEVYDEPIEKIEMPDFMPNMTYKYSESQAREWCNSRNIKLTINYISPTDYGYDASFNGMVVEQSEPYAKLVEEMSSLTITVMGGSGLTDDSMVPSFAGQRYSDAISWAQSKGYSYNVTWKSNNDYGLAGTIISQSVAPYSSIYDYNAISFEAYDYPDITNDFVKAMNNGVNSVVSFANNNGINLTIRYGATGGADGTISSYSSTNYTGDTSDTRTIKTNSSVVCNVCGPDPNAPVTEYTVTFDDGTPSTTTKDPNYSVSGYNCSFDSWSGSVSCKLIKVEPEPVTEYTVTFDDGTPSTTTKDPNFSVEGYACSLSGLEIRCILQSSEGGEEPEQPQE